MTQTKKKIALFTTDDIGAEITSVLLNEKYEVIFITTSDDFALTRNDYSLILCDELLLDKKCLGCSLKNDIPMLLLSEKNSEEVRDIINESNKVITLLQKPFSADKLLFTVNSMLSPNT